MLADRIQNQLTDILAMLIEGYYLNRQEKASILQKTNIELEKLRYYVRLAHDTRCINLSKYEYIQGKINDIGAQVGAWLKISLKKFFAESSLFQNLRQ